MMASQNKRLTCIKVSEEKEYELKIYSCAKEATGVSSLSCRGSSSVRDIWR